jgi:hypothetical protein
VHKLRIRCAPLGYLPTQFLLSTTLDLRKTPLFAISLNASRLIKQSQQDVVDLILESPSGTVFPRSRVVFESAPPRRAVGR